MIVTYDNNHHQHRLDCSVLVLVIVVKMAVIVIFAIIFTFFYISATSMNSTVTYYKAQPASPKEAAQLHPVA